MIWNLDPCQALDLLDAAMTQAAIEALLHGAALLNPEQVVRFMAEHSAQKPLTIAEQFGPDHALEVKASRRRAVERIRKIMARRRGRNSTAANDVAPRNSKDGTHAGAQEPAD